MCVSDSYIVGGCRKPFDHIMFSFFPTVQLDATSVNSTSNVLQEYIGYKINEIWKWTYIWRSGDSKIVHFTINGCHLVVQEVLPQYYYI